MSDIMPIQKSPKFSRVFRSWILNNRLLITKFLCSELGRDISWLYLIHLPNYLAHKDNDEQSRSTTHH